MHVRTSNDGIHATDSSKYMGLKVWIFKLLGVSCLPSSVPTHGGELGGLDRTNIGYNTGYVLGLLLIKIKYMQWTYARKTAGTP